MKNIRYKKGKKEAEEINPSGFQKKVEDYPLNSGSNQTDSDVFDKSFQYVSRIILPLRR